MFSYNGSFLMSYTSWVHWTVQLFTNVLFTVNFSLIYNLINIKNISRCQETSFQLALSNYFWYYLQCLFSLGATQLWRIVNPSWTIKTDASWFRHLLKILVTKTFSQSVSIILIRNFELALLVYTPTFTAQKMEVTVKLKDVHVHVQKMLNSILSCVRGWV